MKTTKVEIHCPNCKQKAVFHSTLTGSYKLYPDQEGNVTCVNCGLNAKHIFTNKDYYYKILVKDRMLFAKDLDNLIILRDYFKDNYKLPRTDPELDFPKEFYQYKDQIVKEINKILLKEMGSR